MSQYVEIIEGEEDEGIDVQEALAILSSNEHRETSCWQLVEEQHFKNGRLDEVHVFVRNVYDKPHAYLDPVKMLVFEIKAIAKSYVMENLADQMRSESEDDED
jgi:hypothetical protein